MSRSERFDSISLSSSLSQFGSRTDVGFKREHNEDSLLVAPPLYVVCDGMGGHEAGEVASEIAVQTIAQMAPTSFDADELARAVENANAAILSAGERGIGREGMGTTCTAAMLDGDRLAVAQVGDSRAYLLHQGELQQITTDHSLVSELVEAGEITPEEARTHQFRSYITRALGLDPYVLVDLYEIKIQTGDRLMLCSDGLYSMVEDADIRNIMATVGNPQECADMLVDAALDGGGTDNITVIVADANGYSPEKAKRVVRRAKWTAITIVAIMVALIVAAVVGFKYWVDNSAYIGVEDGNIAIYKGVPGDFLGMQLSSLEEVSDISIDALQQVQPGTANRIISGDIRCDSLDDARELVVDYKAELKARGLASGTVNSNDTGATTDDLTDDSSDSSDSSADGQDA